MKENFFKILFKESKKFDWESELFLKECSNLILESEKHIIDEGSARKVEDFKKELTELL